MAKYKLLRTDTADSQLRQIVLYVAENFGTEVALQKLDEMEHQIMLLADDPYIGTDPRYMVLRRKEYKVLILEKNLVFYKIDEREKTVMIHAVVDQRQDYLNIIRGL
jgi:toxin ParE1/3/4